jgi:Zn-dependent M28 family amino/carboxypeptidase
MTRRLFPTLALALAACATGQSAQSGAEASAPTPPASQAPAAPATPAIEAARLSEHVRVLSSDAFEGRGPATAGEQKTVEYLSQQLEKLGLEPAGPGGGWTQDVPLNRYDISGPTKLSFKVGKAAVPLTQGEQVAARASMLNVPRVAIKDAPVVFLGYGVKAPERNWDDFKGQDLEGKVGVVLVNDPDFETGQGDFGGKAMTYYGRWTYKYEEAARQGLAGLLIVHETAPASYGWATVKNSNTNTMFDIVREKPAEAHPLLEGWVQRDVAVDLFKRAGLDFEALKKQAQTREFKPVPLKGTTFSADFPVKFETITSKNVVARVKGQSRPDETVLYSAHWDHLGVGPADANGDTIYNGAVDNATGTAALLELARVFVSGPKPERSVAFLWVTAEEKGLLGSAYYAQHPVFPLEKTVGVINIDAISVLGPTRDMTASGNVPLTLQDDLVAALEKEGRRFSPDPRPEAGSYYRSDHFPLAKVGVPAISIGSGMDLVQGGTAAAKAAREDYTAKRYHQPDDEFSDTFDFSGQVQDLTLLQRWGAELAGSTRWPEWKEGAEFKAARDASAASRQ